MKSARTERAPLALTITALTLVANSAAARDSAFVPAAPLVQLTIEHRSMDWRYANGRGTTELDALAITFAEPLGAQTRGGVDLGIVGAHQDGRALTDNLSFSGQVLGIGLTHEIPLLLDLRGVIAAGYHFYAVRDEAATTTARWQWHEWQAGAGLAVPLTDRFRFDVMALLQHIRGYEDVTNQGAASRSDDFRNESKSALAATVTWRADVTGNVGATLQTGSDNGWLLFFNRAY